MQKLENQSKNIALQPKSGRETVSSAFLQTAHKPGSPLFLQRYAGNSAMEPPAGSELILRRKCACGSAQSFEGECEECPTPLPIQRRGADASESTSVVPPIVYDVLRSPGEPLDGATRADMEPRFREDFSQVQVHTDAKAAESARAVNALAYTVGRDVVFGIGEFAPGTNAGRRLIGHELAHVVQQRRGGIERPRVDGKGLLETSAETAAAALVSGYGSIDVTSGSAMGIAAEPASLSEGLIVENKALPALTPQTDASAVTERIKVFHSLEEEEEYVSHLADKLITFIDENQFFKPAMQAVFLAHKFHVLPKVAGKLQAKSYMASGTYLEALDHLFIRKGNMEIRDLMMAYFENAGINRKTSKRVLKMTDEERLSEAIKLGAPALPEEIRRVFVTAAGPLAILAILSRLFGAGIIALATLPFMLKDLWDLNRQYDAFTDIAKHARSEVDLEAAGRDFNKIHATCILFLSLLSSPRSGTVLRGNQASKVGKLKPGGFLDSLSNNIKARLLGALLRGADVEQAGAAVHGESSSTAPTITAKMLAEPVPSSQATTPIAMETSTSTAKKLPGGKVETTQPGTKAQNTKTVGAGIPSPNEADFSNVYADLQNEAVGKGPLVGKRLGRATTPLPPAEKLQVPDTLQEKMNGISDIQKQARVQQMQAKRTKEALERLQDVPDLQKVTAANPYLIEKAETSPSELREHWQRYHEGKPKKSQDFGDYVRIRDRESRGTAGEYGETFARGADEIVVKAPKLDAEGRAATTEPGTDMITYNSQEDRVKLLDNKAVKNTVGKVSALEKNLAKNIADDIAYIKKYASGEGVPPEIAQKALPRMEAALTEINVYMNTHPGANPYSQQTQRAFHQILSKHGIDRVVTLSSAGPNAGISGGLSSKGFKTQ